MCTGPVKFCEIFISFFLISLKMPEYEKEENKKADSSLRIWLLYTGPERSVQF